MAHSTEILAQDLESEQRVWLQVVLCGSFHRAPEQLEDAYEQFVSAGVQVLSPSDLNFVGERAGFLFAAHERDEMPSKIEQRHLGAMRRADFVWLHAPGGYVGTSAALELGYANALGLTVYCAELPREEAFHSMVRLARDPREAIIHSTPEQLGADAPTRALSALQEYYRRTAERRGWDQESAAETVDLLGGELQELQQALAATANMSQAAADEDPVAELADVALYVVHLANVLGVDLGAAISAKEQVNAKRFPIREQQPA